LYVKYKYTCTEQDTACKERRGNSYSESGIGKERSGKEEIKTKKLRKKSRAHG